MRTLFVLLSLALLAPVVAAVVGWRVDGTSRFPTAVPPAKWGTADGVLWATDLPSWSNAGPVLVGDRIFVNAEPSTLLCLDTSGKILWQHANAYEDLLTDEEKAKLNDERTQLAPIDKQERELNNALKALSKQQKQAEDNLKAKPDDPALQAALAQVKDDTAKQQAQLNDVKKQKAPFKLPEQYRLPDTHGANGYTSDTPVSDGTRVYACYGNGVVACYTLDGVRQWARLIEKPTHGWGHSGSPVLIGNTLVVQFVNMFGLDAATGKQLWQHGQPHDWGTPAVTKIGNLDVMMTDNGHLINAADGTELGATGFRMEYGSPMIIGNVAYCASGNHAAAFQLAPAAGNAVQVTKLWQTEVSNNRYYASPLLDNDLLYLVNAGNILTVLDAKTGEKCYEQALNLGGCSYPSPVLDGSAIVLAGESGKVAVITPGRTYQEISRFTLDPFRSTPVCIGKRVYLRALTKNGHSKLYCFGE